ncbi:Protein of unknown function (DUF3616) [Leptolyngbya sp. PCC 7375]|nr:Protein of unknown function (DUF3616) [Leptolyngbya sp. PCC 7375]
MADSFLLSRVLLQFGEQAENVIADLSAVAMTPDGSLWVGSDECVAVERLQRLESCVYGDHQAFQIGDFVELFDDESEIDIEALGYAEGYLWVIGSHSSKRKNAKGKDPQKDIQRLAKIKHDINRYLLARIPVIKGKLVKSCELSDGTELTAAALQKTKENNILIEALKEDEHIGPFLDIDLPSKDNGLDIEGMAIAGHRVFLGLRGPVLRGWAIILELELQEKKPGVLSFKSLGKDKLYHKHFLDLDGLGVRDLYFHDGDLLILAGPTMTLSGEQQIFRLKDVLNHGDDCIWHKDSDKLEALFDIPLTMGSDFAEGMTLFPYLGYKDSLMVVYDRPAETRRVGTDAVFADVFRLST